MRQSKLIKIIFIVVILFASIQFSYAQKTEINFNAYSGLFSFRGNGSVLHSGISYPFTSTTIYTTDPFGRRSGFSYVLEFQAQRLSKTNNIYGFGISFEQLTSKVNINKIITSQDPAYFEYPASGKTTLRNTFITLNPFVGHRYSYHKATFDVLAGCDLAFCLKSKEAGKASINNKDFVKAENDKAKPFIDFRPRVQIKMKINKVGFLAGYSFGLTNYQAENNLKAWTRFLRLGLSYQLK